MIKITCYSRDEDLLEMLRALYGAESVLVESGKTFSGDSGKNCDLVIVDLKCCELLKDAVYTSPVIVLTELPNFKEGFELLQRGLRGYGNIHMRKSNLEQAVQSVSAGQMWLPPDVVNKLIDIVGGNAGLEGAKERETILDALSKREREVALLVAQGMSNQEVADKMFVSLRTVKAHLSSIYEKTTVRNRLELGLALS